jgi:hypothetical protein
VGFRNQDALPKQRHTGAKAAEVASKVRSSKKHREELEDSSASALSQAAPRGVKRRRSSGETTEASGLLQVWLTP